MSEKVKETVPAVPGEEEKASDIIEGTATPTTSEDAEAASAAPGDETAEQIEAKKAEDAKTHEIKKERRAKRAAKEEAAIERARAEEAEKKLLELKNASKPQGRPNRDNYESEEDYEDALVDYRLDLKQSASAKQDTEAKQKRKAEENRIKYNAGVPEAEDKFDDFHEIAGDAGDNITSLFLADQIKASSKAHDIVYHLGKNPEEATRLSTLSEFEQIREIGKLEARLEAEPDQNKITRTPDPGAEITGAGVGGAGGKEETTAEYIARTNAEEVARWNAEG